MKQHETRKDEASANVWENMDEAEALAVFRHWAAVEQSAKQKLRAAADEFTTARKLRDRSGAELRDRFAVDPRTGRRIRKGKALFSLTG